MLVFIIALCITGTNAFTIKLGDICKPGSWCHYFMDGTKKIIYGADKGEIPDSDSVCLQQKIEQCSCYEILLLEKSVIPSWPKIDATDVRKLRRHASKIYHSDVLDKNYSGDTSAPFIFLQKCAVFFQNPGVRKDYTDNLEILLTSLGTDSSMESIARSVIYRFNIKFIEKHQNTENFYSGKQRENMDKSIERLHIFLDNTQTMQGDGLQKGKKIFQSLERRIFDTPTNVYLIDHNSRKILSEEIELNAQNVDSYVYNLWDAKGKKKGGLYLWEYVWFAMNNKKSTDCEIIIITDGFDTYRTAGSSVSFVGVEGLNYLMTQLKNLGNKICRTFIYCVSKECKEEVGKSYLDMTIATGGFACDHSNFDDCNLVLTLSHGERMRFANDLKNDHVDKVKSGELKALPWVDYRILKADL